ncbi:hypothetical protein ETH_00030660 [Eimeria tenella]|uniref:Uncharacterized protein n=1 Tax=Eimeria tenella TaxID=5802 RepID=U6L719_EIMTE|nr:hypothetical protein ETH_00030660 [Eimeria tenella]CDJ43585.1 hypothetical protein ETH_00030660 [Eimeria tenella]|eukprot:XP_013234335.1 hypothetical protein ETH_00030660 [Eimeria tenella]
MMRAVATGPNAIPVSLERGNSLRNTEEENKMSDEVVQGTQPPLEARLEFGPAPMRNEEAPCVKADSSGKSTEATEEPCGPEAIETMPHWWRETTAKESCNQGGDFCYVNATAVLRVELAGSSCEDAWRGINNSHAKTKAKAHITSVVRQAAADAKNLRALLHGLHYILAMPDDGSSVALRFTDEWQGALCCALIGIDPKPPVVAVLWPLLP